MPESVSSKEVDEFADSIVAELIQRHPPRVEDVGERKELARLRKAFSRVFSRIDAFARAHPMSLYSKARLANRVQWGLKDAGYRKDFVETATHEVATHVAIAGTRAGASKDR
ncbi:hypothetical protein D3C83_26350 [compost metagenome]